MPNLSRHADDPCDEYSSQWQQSTSGPDGIAEYFGGTEKLSSVDRKSLSEVIRADIERTWEHWATSIEDQVQRNVDPDLLLKQWQQLPWFQSYAGLFTGPEEMARFWAQLANIEAACRDRWGDAIGSPYYLHHCKVNTVGFARRTRRLLRCDFENNDEYTQLLFPLRGRNEIGRQRSKDVEPYFCESLPSGNRIVVANRCESEVSREQLALQLLTPAVAVVTNQSQVNSIRLSPDCILAPGAKACACFPFTVQIPGRRLSFY